MRIVWAVIFLGALSPSGPTEAAAPLAPAASGPRPITVTLSRTVANVEFLRSNLYAAPPRGTPRLPAMGGTPWYGEIVRRLPQDVATLGLDHFVPFVAEYIDGRPARAWCDTNLDGRLDDAPPVTLSAYSPIEGARSFLARLSWTVSNGNRPIVVDNTIRVVLEPATGRGAATPPQFRLQSVFAMTGTATLEGRPHRVFLLDGDGDGLYTRGLLDGLFVDIDDDGRFVVDAMGPEFASLRVPFAFGGTSYEAIEVDPDGRRVVLEPLGPGAAPPPGPEVGAAAPDFSFTAIDGRDMRLSALRGRPVLIYFWASFCRTCTDQAGDLLRLYDRYRASGLEIVAISYDTDRAAMDEFRARNRQTWPTSYSGHQLWEDPVGRLYRERGTGVLYLVDSAGTLVQISSQVASIESALTSLGR
jgi:thiol-disulfide isomerase/thioredoxin